MAESLRELVERVRADRKAQMDGCYCGGDEEMCRPCRLVMVSESELATALLTSRAVEAVEVLRAWGEARANLRRVNDETWDQGRVGYVARRDAERAEGDPRRAVEMLADALAEEVG